MESEDAERKEKKLERERNTEIKFWEKEAMKRNISWIGIFKQEKNLEGEKSMTYNSGEERMQSLKRLPSLSLSLLNCLFTYI